MVGAVFTFGPSCLGNPPAPGCRGPSRDRPLRDIGCESVGPWCRQITHTPPLKSSPLCQSSMTDPPKQMEKGSSCVRSRSKCRMRSRKPGAKFQHSPSAPVPSSARNSGRSFKALEAVTAFVDAMKRLPPGCGLTESVRVQATSAPRGLQSRPLETPLRGGCTAAQGQPPLRIPPNRAPVGYRQSRIDMVREKWVHQCVNPQRLSQLAKQASILVVGSFFWIILNGCTHPTTSLSANHPRLRPLEFLNLTNGEILEGDVSLPFKGNVSNFNKGQIYLIVNHSTGSPMSVSISQDAAGRYSAHWHTQDCPNGLYDVYLEDDDESGEPQYYGATNSIILSNWITFPTWNVAGSQMWVFARVAAPHSDWRVEVSDAKSNYLGYFVGTTTNGLINFIWDYKDAKGVYHTSEGYYSLGFSATAVAGSKAVVPLVHPNVQVEDEVATDLTPRKMIEPK